MTDTPAGPAVADSNELHERVRELEAALYAIRAGQVDAFVMPHGLATSDSARAAVDLLRLGTLEQMRDAVLAFDHAGHVLYMNPAAERQYGWASVEALGRPRATIYEEQPDAASADTAPACAALIHTLHNGRAIHVESTVSPLLDGAGAKYGSVAVVRDVTERRRAEDRRNALARLAERLRQAEDASRASWAAEQALAAGLGSRASDLPWSVPLPAAGTPAGVLAGCSPDAAQRWTPAELEFGRDVADRTRAAFERIEAAAALRESEARLRQANENLETAIRLRTNELMVAEEALRQAQKMEA
ncbi:MAG TPA: PAS domain S-box protein, partial [Ramlibacter sp.]